MISSAEITVIVNKAKSKIADLCEEMSDKLAQGESIVKIKQQIQDLSAGVRTFENDNDLTQQQKKALAHYLNSRGNLTQVPTSVISALSYSIYPREHSFLSLIDTPDTYQAGYLLMVNLDADAVEFINKSTVLSTVDGSKLNGSNTDIAGTDAALGGSTKATLSADGLDLELNGTIKETVDPSVSGRNNYFLRFSNYFLNWLATVIPRLFKSGGTAGQVIVKNSGTNFDFDWDTLDITDITGTVPINRGGTGQITANAALNALLPTQVGQANEFLQTNGTDSTWTNIQTFLRNFTHKVSANYNNLTAVIAGATANLATDALTEADTEAVNSTDLGVVLTAKTWDSSVVGAGPYMYEVTFSGTVKPDGATTKIAVILYKGDAAAVGTPVSVITLTVATGVYTAFSLHAKVALANGETLRIRVVGDQADTIRFFTGFYNSHMFQMEANLLTTYS